MDNIMPKKKIVGFAVLVLFLIFGLSFSFCQAQSESDSLKPLQLVSMQLSERTSFSPVISMDFQDADLKDILKIFSQQARLNFIASERIKDRKVTLYLDKVSVQDALNTLMRANNLIYEQKEDSEIFVVKEWGKPEVETITKVFALQYARVKGYELTAAGSEQRATEKIGIKEVVKELLTRHGKVVEDARTNSLIVTDLPSQFPKIEQAIEELDIRLPQVMIEVEIIEASVATIDKLGIEWGSAADGIFASAYGASRPDKFPFTNNPSIVGPDGNRASLYTGYISATSLGGTLAMLTTDTDTKILARPKILTLNNETAEIYITADATIATEETQVSTEGGLGTRVTSAERAETGVKLKVTPQINKAGEITMIIEPEVITTDVSALSTDFLDAQSRRVRTTVVVNDGETVIIGGLIKTEDSRSLRKVPFLGNIPFLGAIFQKKDNSSTDKELIIFITPHLVKKGLREPGLTLEKQGLLDFASPALKEETIEEVLDAFEEY